MEHTTIHLFIRHLAIYFPTLVTVFSLWGITRSKVAHNLGYTFVSYLGYNSYNPLNHIDPVGVFMFACLLSFRMLGSTPMAVFILFWLMMIFMGVQIIKRAPLDHHTLLDGSRLRALAVTISGTVALFLFALLVMYMMVYLPYFLGVTPGVMAILELLREVMTWSIFIGILYLLPFPPFEGGALLPIAFGQKGEEIVDAVEPYGLIILLCLLFLPGVSDWFWSFITMLGGFVQMGLLKLVWV